MEKLPAFPITHNFSEDDIREKIQIKYCCCIPELTWVKLLFILNEIIAQFSEWGYRSGYVLHISL